MADQEKLTTKEAAEYMGISFTTLNRARAKDEGPAYYRLMGSVYYKRADLDIYMESGRTEPKS